MIKKIREWGVVVYRKSLENKAISLACIFFIMIGLYYALSSKAGAVLTYQYTNVKRGPLSSIVSGTGQVISNSQVDLKPKVNANVTGVYVRAGDRVKAGQVLFRLDATDAYKQVRDAKTSLEAANIALLKLQNPKTIDVMSVNDSIKQEEDSKRTQDVKVDTAHRTLLNANLQALPEVSYTEETAPSITGSYTGTTEGQIRIIVYRGGDSGYSFMTSGLVTIAGQANSIVAQPIGNTGLYIKWNSTTPQTNWVISIPNKQSSSYASNYNAWQNAIVDRDIANAASDRTIANLKQKLADLTPGDDNLDVQSAKLTVTQRQNALTDAQQTLSNYTIVAPFDGAMASVAVDIGASAVMASANSSAALGTIVTDKKLAQITVNESDITKVHLGQKATITFDAIDGLEIPGEIVEVNTLGVVTSGVVTYKVKLAFDTNDPRILPNMSVSADIITDSKDNALYLPTQAVKHDTNGYYVEVDASSTASSTLPMRPIEASSTREGGFGSTTMASSTRKRANASSTYRQINGTATTSSTAVTVKRVPVMIGIQTDTQTEITSGLYEGEQVILKKVSTTGATSGTTAPSITSLFRPQQSATKTPASGAATRAQ